jgi:hypothetical protein
VYHHERRLDSSVGGESGPPGDSLCRGNGPRKSCQLACGACPVTARRVTSWEQGPDSQGTVPLNNFGEKVAFIWGVADLLRGDYQRMSRRKKEGASGSRVERGVGTS